MTQILNHKKIYMKVPWKSQPFVPSIKSKDIKKNKTIY